MKRLNFGCGKIIKKGWTNVDFQKAREIDKSFDFTKYPYPFKDDTFDYVLIDNVLEHLQDPQKVMKEIQRISKRDAIVEIIVPYYNSYYAWGDPTHVNFFNEFSIKQTLEGVEYSHHKEKLFKIIQLTSVPQRFLRWIPKKTLNGMKKLLGNIIVELRIKARVLK